MEPEDDGKSAEAKSLPVDAAAGDGDATSLSASMSVSPRKKWKREEVNENLDDDFAVKMKGEQKKVTRTHVMDKMGEEEKEQMGKDARTIISAMQNINLTEFKGVDENMSSSQFDLGARNRVLVNILSFNHNDRDVDYGEIFGDDVDSAGVKVWVMENWKVRAVPPGDYGKFHAQDCYLILHVSDPGVSKVKSIHTWIGKDATADKAATCAIRAVMLNNFLSGQGRHHREEQGNESELFISYFFRHHGVQHQDGSLCGAFFKKPGPFMVEPALYVVRPKEYPRMRLVDLSHEILSEQDVFVLDAGLTLYQWNGRKSDLATRFKALDLCRRMNDHQRNCNARIVSVEQGSEDDDFRAYLSVPTRVEVCVPLDHKPQVKMYKTGWSDETKKPVVLELTPPFRREALDSRHCLIVDAFTEVFVWVGRFASRTEKKIAEALAKRFVGMQRDPNQKRPQWAETVLTVRDGAESVTFRMKFVDWYDVHPPPDYARAISFRRRPAIAKSVPLDELIDIEKLYAGSEPPAQEEIDDGSGVIEMWNLERAGPKFVKLPLTERGHLYSGDCYLVLYTYYDERDQYKQKYIAYFWQGRDSNDKWFPSFLWGFYPLLRKKMSALGHQNRIRYARIWEQKEPDHFLRLFKNRLIIHRGRRKARKEKEDDEVMLYDVKDAGRGRTLCIQVPAFPEHLHSRDSFVLLTPTQCFVWHGYCTRQQTRDAADAIARNDLLGGRDDPVVMDEELEEDAFWDALGNKTTYADSAYWQKMELNEARLFHCTTLTGLMRVDELHSFSQADFDDESVFWVDAHATLYVWYGLRAKGNVRRLASALAHKYATYASEVREKEVRVVDVESGLEPQEFKWQFHAWKDRVPFEDPRVQRERELRDDFYLDKQLAEDEANLARDERWQRKEGEFDETPFIERKSPVSSNAIKMEPAGNGSFAVRLVLRPGMHLYRFVVDGKPAVDEKRPTEKEGDAAWNVLRLLSRKDVAVEHVVTWSRPASGDAPADVLVVGFDDGCKLPDKGAVGRAERK